MWDKLGTRYGFGRGLHVLAYGSEIASSEKLERLTAQLPKPAVSSVEEDWGLAPLNLAVNFAVNNDSGYFPRVSASHSGPNSSPAKLIDGNYWYHASPPNRWTAEGSTTDSDWVAIDFGTRRKIHTVKLYVLDDGKQLTAGGAKIAAPRRIDLEYWIDGQWKPVPNQSRSPALPTGHRPNVIRFPEMEVAQLRAVLWHSAGAKSGLTEFEAWGDSKLPIMPTPVPSGNLAFNPGDKPFPKASASFTSRFDKIETAIDGQINFAPNPANRWTSYESKHERDWLEIDFGAPKSFSRIELAIYDDHGGVQAPASYTVQYFDGSDWREAAKQVKSPAAPLGGVINSVRFDRVTAAKVRVLFTHQGQARSGVSEILVWKE